MLHFATPFYICYVLQNIAFLITFSPVGADPENFKLQDKLSFASLFISNFFFIAMMTILVWVARSGELSEPPPGAIIGTFTVVGALKKSHLLIPLQRNERIADGAYDTGAIPT